ncbi:MAG: Holliday junction branch migration protein RuvA [Deltaproteobacteria bacterium CG_4_8_14_3_um_filter_51_11]|nr:Holliday junction branch migration protein RuvA [bacterium]OIP43286.1 MAG: Holliday junction DNA helicase RuvA [Desulfobacteraceae bacterium CG2_30_51_40]PIP48194.1 MAG: Holliday junction branch migration protein RuvA [Deltaproteobacteria bacterium CG23_combo_of_CG06-09_8_20_14_all_51_20]PIX19586.1 MAG: Holliday junction branch migration protein RuvA [Deltaproteobacteria bacterium CG_4_8_14_3_um_filter_51_11]PIY21502.1 MAG: Holliday junction branch migration protein RuvA [Deltaproteobacteria
MIGYLSGTLLIKTPQSVTVDVNGVGYEIVVPLSTFYGLPDIGGKVELFIHTHLREDTLVLFGFQSAIEKSLFLLLITVSGIGPRLSLNILSGIGPSELVGAISRGDSARLQAIPGIGRKTAERISLELKDKAGRITDMEESRKAPSAKAEPQLMDDALSALVNLGYTGKSARAVLEKTMARLGDAGLEVLIREALRII